jgi:signal transduction histidine kinase
MGLNSVILIDDSFVLIMGTLTLVFIVLIVTLFAFLFQRRLIKKQKAFRAIELLLQKQEMKSAYAILEAQEFERQRISEDLHDRLGSKLAAVKLHFLAYKNSNGKTMDFFRIGSNLLDDAVDEVREISHNMVSGVLSKFGLVVALQDLKNTIESSNQFTFQFHNHQLDGRLDMNTEINLYRIVQELVSNILKHSQANEIILQLNRYESELLLTIEDNGIGFDSGSESLKKGMGLKNIETRVAKLNGKIHIDSHKGKGSIITIEIPLNK